MSTAIATRLARFCTPNPRPAPAQRCSYCGTPHSRTDRLTCSDFCAAKLERELRACEARRASDYADYRAGILDPRD